MGGCHFLAAIHHSTGFLVGLRERERRKLEFNWNWDSSLKSLEYAMKKLLCRHNSIWRVLLASLLVLEGCNSTNGNFRSDIYGTWQEWNFTSLWKPVGIVFHFENAFGKAWEKTWTISPSLAMKRTENHKTCRIFTCHLLCIYSLSFIDTLHHYFDGLYHGFFLCPPKGDWRRLSLKGHFHKENNFPKSLLL